MDEYQAEDWSLPPWYELTYEQKLSPEDGYLPLHIAASSRDIKALTQHLTSSDSLHTINIPDSWNNTPLHIAIQNDDVAAVKLLLSHGADPSRFIPDDYGNPQTDHNSLSLASRVGSVGSLKAMVGSGGPIISRVLKYAVEGGMLDCVQEIFAWMERDDKRLDDGELWNDIVGLSLGIAAYNWRTEAVEFILGNHDTGQRYVDSALHELFLKDYDDFHTTEPVLRYTSEGRQQRLDVLNLLLDAGADANAVHNQAGFGRTPPLHTICSLGELDLGDDRESFKDMFEILIRRTSINLQDECGHSPLSHAVRADDMYFTQRLIGEGADIAWTGKDGNTLLHVAVTNLWPSCEAIVLLLLKHGISSKQRDQLGETPLHRACRSGNVSAVKLLLAHRAGMIHETSDLGLTALHFAADACWRRGNEGVEVAEILLSHGTDVNARSRDGCTVLQRAILNIGISEEFVEFLLREGADVNASATLHKSTEAAADTQIPERVCNTRLKDQNKGNVDSLLHLAAQRRLPAIVSALLNHGADIEATDSSGRTPLLCSVIGHADFLSTTAMGLLNRGADYKVKDDEGIDLDEAVRKYGWVSIIDGGRVTGFKDLREPEKPWNLVESKRDEKFPASGRGKKGLSLKTGAKKRSGKGRGEW